LIDRDGRRDLPSLGGKIGAHCLDPVGLERDADQAILGRIEPGKKVDRLTIVDTEPAGWPFRPDHLESQQVTVEGSRTRRITRAEG